MIKNTIDFVAYPNNEVDLSLNQLPLVKKFLKNFTCHTSRGWYLFNDTNEEIEISLSGSGIVYLTVRIFPEYTERVINLLSKISKKICAIISEEEFTNEVFILETRRIDFRETVGEPIRNRNVKSINFEGIAGIKTKIIYEDEIQLVSLRNIKDITKIPNIYHSILNGKISEDIKPTEADVTIKFSFA